MSMTPDEHIAIANYWGGKVNELEAKLEASMLCIEERDDKIARLEAIIKESKEQKPVLWVDMQDVAKLKQLKLPVLCIHEQYDADYHPLFAAPVMKEKDNG